MLATETRPRPLQPYEAALTPVLARMIEHRGITSIAELRTRRDELAGTTGFNPRAMDLIDRTLEEVGMQETEATVRYAIVARTDIEPWPGLNPRTEFDEGKLAELAESIRQKGLLEPLVVHDLAAPQPEHRPEVAAAIAEALARGVHFWVVAGERRFRATAPAELEQLPAVVGVYTEAEALDVALIENLQRVDMGALDEARAFRRRLEPGDITAAELAERIGKSPSYISNHVRLLQLPDAIHKLIEEGVLMPSHARDFILPFSDIPAGKWKKLTIGIAKAIRDDRDGLFGDEKLRGEDVRELVGHVAEDLSRTLDPKAYRDAPLFDPKKHSECSCGGPLFQYGWNGDKKEVRCFDEKWWDAQQAEAKSRAKEREKKQKEKAAKVAEEGGPLKTFASMNALVDAKGYDYVTVGRESGFDHNIYDLSKIPAEKLVFAKTPDGLTLVCLGNSAASKGRVTKERDQLVSERRAAAAAADLEAAAKTSVKPADAYRWLIEDLLDGLYGESKFCRMLEGIGIDPDEETVEKDDDGNEVVSGFDLADISDDQLTTWVKLFVMKSERGDYPARHEYVRPGDDPIVKEVEKELRKKYTPALRAFFAAHADDAPAPATNGKKPAKAKKPKGGRNPVAPPGAVPADAIVSGAQSAALRAAEAVRMSGLFNR